MVDEKDLYSNMCFVIMPIGEGMIFEHFKHVYDDIFNDPIKKAGYKPKRADDDKSSNLIQVNIIRDIINAPMAICDLSTRNPNVLFELGIRQAFDLPVVLVQEVGTPRIFDISTINTIEYRKERIFHEVLEDRDKIYNALVSTKENIKGINSIIKLLEVNKANPVTTDKLTDIDEIKLLLYKLTGEVEKNRKVNYLTNDWNVFTDSLSTNLKGCSELAHYNISIDNELVEIEEALNNDISMIEVDKISTKLNYIKGIVKSDLRYTNVTKSRYMNEIGKLQKKLTSMK